MPGWDRRLLLKDGLLPKLPPIGPGWEAYYDEGGIEVDVENGPLSIIETHRGCLKTRYTTIIVGEGVAVNHCLVYGQGKSDRFTSDLNGEHIIEVRFDGEGGQYTLNGFYSLVDQQRMNSTVTVLHSYANCTSVQNFRCVAHDRSVVTIDSLARVGKRACGSKTRQDFKSMLLSPHATIETKPQLEIHNNDVQCTHGATTGQLDEDAIFYLRSRGIDEDGSKQMLIAAFMNEAIDKVEDEVAKHWVEESYAGLI
ncbi:hypothetical protein LCGC14_1448830 [marine sediment metagenome]|uniref:SUF system FeS cluster assembly SufBD core domain-containing protein n=1 Tax=marine sediment metagenome TaxID=412755 RepID=A0A0F9MKC5_9ZZZZ